MVWYFYSISHLCAEPEAEQRAGAGGLVAVEAAAGLVAVEGATGLVAVEEPDWLAGLALSGAAAVGPEDALEPELQAAPVLGAGHGADTWQLPLVQPTSPTLLYTVTSHASCRLGRHGYWCLQAGAGVLEVQLHCDVPAGLADLALVVTLTRTGNSRHLINTFSISIFREF